MLPELGATGLSCVDAVYLGNPYNAKKSASTFTSPNQGLDVPDVVVDFDLSYCGLNAPLLLEPL